MMTKRNIYRKKECQAAWNLSTSLPMGNFWIHEKRAFECHLERFLIRSCCSKQATMSSIYSCKMVWSGWLIWYSSWLDRDNRLLYVAIVIRTLVDHFIIWGDQPIWLATRYIVSSPSVVDLLSGQPRLPMWSTNPNKFYCS